MSPWWYLGEVVVFGVAILASLASGDVPPLARKGKGRRAPEPSRQAIDLDPLGADLLDALAARLDLAHAGRRVEGMTKGIAIEIVAEPYGSAEPELLRCTARFATPLELGIDVRGGTTAGMGAEALVSTGFDAALHVEAEKMPAAQRMLRGRAGDLLLAFALEERTPWLDDREVGVVMPASVAEAASAIERLIRVVQAAEAAHRALPGAQDARRRALDALADIATRTGGSVDEATLEVVFAAKSGDVAVRLDDALGMLVEVVFTRALPGELSADFGDRASPRLVERGELPFDPDAHHALLRLVNRVDALHLDATRLSVEARADELDAVVELADALATRSASDPYR